MNAAMLSSGSGNWETPQAFFDKLDEEFGFELDVCASTQNTKCAEFFTAEQNGLVQDWTGRVCYMNPPYGRNLSAWVKKAADEAARGATVVGLFPARTDTRWFHDGVAKATEVRFLKGRLYFSGADRAPFPSMLGIWRPTPNDHRRSAHGPLWTVFERWI